ncbi:MAG: hypothetical protein WAM60_25560, partial [Candidatus Promineifilaceae bacterium]
FTLAVWVIPVVVVVVGGLLFGLYIQSIQTKRTASDGVVQETEEQSTPEEASPQDDYMAQIEQELKARTK